MATLASETVTLQQRELTHAGSRYHGQISIAKGCREGEGDFAYPSPLMALSPGGGEPFFVYSGQWSGGEKHGQGRLSFADGGFYEGQFERGEIVGDGMQEWVDKEGKPIANYTGKFNHGARHGSGRYEREDGTLYDGEWAWNKYHGEGELLLPNGDHYVGGFQKHKYHGEGKLLQPNNGIDYEGGFEDGFFHGIGQLKQMIDDEFVFEYDGQFTAGAVTGHGTGRMANSCIAHGPASWTEAAPDQLAQAWDLGPAASQESYLMGPVDKLKEEAAAQLEPEKDAKAKKKPEGKKGQKDKEETPAETPSGPELIIQAGSPMPDIVLRVVDKDGQTVTPESGRRFRVTMYRERKAPPSDEFPEGQVVRRDVQFGDLRKSVVDPLDPVPGEKDKPGKAGAKSAARKNSKSSRGDASPTRKPSKAGGAEGSAASRKSSKSAGAKRGAKKDKEGALPEELLHEEPPIDDPSPTPEPVYEGTPSVSGVIGMGSSALGSTQDWFIPSHLVAAVYWLQIEDVTDLEDTDMCPWQILPSLSLPVRVLELPPEEPA